jgi:hypothetical protein
MSDTKVTHGASGLNVNAFGSPIDVRFKEDGGDFEPNTFRTGEEDGGDFIESTDGIGEEDGGVPALTTSRIDEEDGGDFIESNDIERIGEEDGGDFGYF